MSGKFVVRAGQHKFESGEKAVSPVTVLPTAPMTIAENFLFQRMQNQQKIIFELGVLLIFWGLELMIINLFFLKI